MAEGASEVVILESQKSDVATEEVPECCICVETALHPVKLPCTHVFCKLLGHYNLSIQNQTAQDVSLIFSKCSGFLCVKGCYLQQGGLCPLCRTPIPPAFIEKPKLVGVPSKKKMKKRNCSTPGSSDSSSKKKKTKRAANATPQTPTQTATPPASVTSPTSPPGKAWYYEGRSGGWWQYDERTAAQIDHAVEKGESSVEILIAGNMYVLDLVGKEQIAKHNPNLKRRIKADSTVAACKGVAGLAELRHS